MSKKFKNGDFSLIENVPYRDTFGSLRRKRFTAYLLECFLGLPTNSINPKDLTVWSEKILEKFSFDDKEYRADVVVTYQNEIYDFEPFLYFGTQGLIKSICYGDRIFSSQFESGDSYKNLKKVIQFVIVRDVDVNIHKECITENVFSKNGVILSDGQKIIIVRLDKLDKFSYNEGESDTRLFELLLFLKAKNQSERDELVKGGKNFMLKEINEFVKRFMKSEKANKKYQKYNFQEKIWLEEGYSNGQKDGIALGNKKFAKYLQSNGKTIEEISNTMELPMKEIQELLKS